MITKDANLMPGIVKILVTRNQKTGKYIFLPFPECTAQTHRSKPLCLLLLALAICLESTRWERYKIATITAVSRIAFQTEKETLCVIKANFI
jgi:hypothetical protein